MSGEYLKCVLGLMQSFDNVEREFRKILDSIHTLVAEAQKDRQALEQMQQLFPSLQVFTTLLEANKGLKEALAELPGADKVVAAPQPPEAQECAQQQTDTPPSQPEPTATVETLNLFGSSGIKTQEPETLYSDREISPDFRTFFRAVRSKTVLLCTTTTVGCLGSYTAVQNTRAFYEACVSVPRITRYDATALFYMLLRVDLSMVQQILEVFPKAVAAFQHVNKYFSGDSPWQKADVFTSRMSSLWPKERGEETRRLVCSLIYQLAWLSGAPAAAAFLQTIAHGDVNDNNTRLAPVDMLTSVVFSSNTLRAPWTITDVTKEEMAEISLLLNPLLADLAPAKQTSLANIRADLHRLPHLLDLPGYFLPGIRDTVDLFANISFIVLGARVCYPISLSVAEVLRTYSLFEIKRILFYASVLLYEIGVIRCGWSGAVVNRELRQKRLSLLPELQHTVVFQSSLFLTIQILLMTEGDLARKADIVSQLRTLLEPLPFSDSVLAEWFKPLLGFNHEKRVLAFTVKE